MNFSKSTTLQLGTTFQFPPVLMRVQRLVIITIISIIITIIVTENSNYFFVSFCFEATPTEEAIHSEALKKLLQKRSLELYNLRKEVKEKRFCYANLTLEDLQFYTGITSKELFCQIINFGRPFTGCIDETQILIV